MPVDISLDEFCRIVTACSNVDSVLGPDAVRSHYDLLVSNLHRSGISDRVTLAMFLANVMHDTDGLNVSSDSHPDPTVYWHDGRNYFGRGYIRLTFWYNYRDASEAIYGDDRLFTDPDVVARDASVAWSTAMWLWRDRVRPQLLSSGSGNFDAAIWAIDPSELAERATECDRQKADRRRELYAIIREILDEGESIGQVGDRSINVNERQTFRSSELRTAA